MKAALTHSTATSSTAPQRTVLHLRSSGDFLGAERVIVELAHELPALGFRPIICCLTDNDDPAPKLLQVAADTGIEHRSIWCDHKFDLRAVAALSALLQREHVSVLHTHGYKADLYGLLAGRHTPKVATNHLWKSSSTALRLYRELDALLLRLYPKVAAVSKAILSEMSRRGLPFQKLRYIPNGINGDYLQNDAEAHPAPNPFSPQASPKVLSVARLSPEKGHAYLIDAWLTVNEHISTAELALVGDGPLREELEHRVHHHFLERKIHLVGSSSCVPSLLRTSDLFVLPSLAEGLPMALLEAMSFGLGVVATDVGEVSSVLNHCGRVVPPGEVTGLANALVELGANLHRARELGGAARQRVKALYSAKKMAERYGALYLEVLSQQSSPQAQA